MEGRRYAIIVEQRRLVQDALFSGGNCFFPHLKVMGIHHGESYDGDRERVHLFQAGQYL